MERRLAGFGVEVRRVVRRARPGVASVSHLPELLPCADAVVPLEPVTSATVGMADPAFRPG